MQPGFLFMDSEYNSASRDNHFLTPPLSNTTDASDYISHHSAPSKLASISIMPLPPPAKKDLCQVQLAPHICLTDQVMDQYHEYQTALLRNPLYLASLQQDSAAELAAAMQSLDIGMLSYNHTSASEGQGMLPMSRFEAQLSESYHCRIACDTSTQNPYMNTAHHQTKSYDEVQTSGQGQPSSGSYHGHSFEYSLEMDFLSNNDQLRDENLCGVGSKFQGHMVHEWDVDFEALCEQLASAPLTYNSAKSGSSRPSMK